MSDLLTPKHPKSKQSTKICRKLLWICYYYCCSLGTVALRLKKCTETNCKIRKRFKRCERPYQETENFRYEVYVPKYILGPYISIRILLIFGFVYGLIHLWLMEDYMFTVLVYSHVSTIVICPLVMIWVEVRNRDTIKGSLNSLFHLLRDIEELNENYEVFQWTHVGFLVLKVLVFLLEISVLAHSFTDFNLWFEYLLLSAQSILLSEIWMNFHLMTLLYVSLEAIYGSLNNYMQQNLMLRLKALQKFEDVSRASRQSNQLALDMEKFIELYKRVHVVGLKLHRLWQLPFICTQLSIYFGLLSIIYYLLWQYIQLEIIHYRLYLYILKLAIDMSLLSIATHRVIRGSTLIGLLGLEKSVLVQDERWQRQMEQFLFYLNLYEFKLNLMGLFDITNKVTLTFISGIVTAISIFIPFAVKTYHLQIFMGKQN